MSRKLLRFRKPQRDAGEAVRVRLPALDVERCSYCLEEIHPWATKCPHCRSALLTVEEAIRRGWTKKPRPRKR